MNSQWNSPLFSSSFWSCWNKQLEGYLKKRVNQEGRIHVRDVRPVNSANNNLIQLADMVAGAINRSLGAKSDARVYRQLIVHRQMFVQFWPQEIEKPKS